MKKLMHEVKTFIPCEVEEEFLENTLKEGNVFFSIKFALDLENSESCP